MTPEDGVDELADNITGTEESQPDEEIDELDESDAGLDPASTVIEDWARGIPTEKFMKWSTVPPELRKKKQQKTLAREKAKARRQAKSAGHSRRGSKGKREGTEDANGAGGESGTGAEKAKGRRTSGRRAKGKPSEDVEAADTITNPSRDSSDVENKPQAKRARTDVSSGSTPREYTAYILIQQASQPIPGSSRTARFSKANPVPEPTSSEPVFFNDDDTFDDFLAKIATTLSCHADSICLDQSMWVFEKPKNGQKRPLGTEAGYQAMVKQLQTRKQDQWVVNIHMPPPKQIRSTRKKVETQREHDYDDYVEDPASMSLQEQITTVARTCAPLMQRLEDRYPINNLPNMFPRKRMFSRGGHYWELTNLRLQAWAKAWSKGEAGVDIENPPNTMHFDLQHAMKAPQGAVPNNDSNFALASLTSSHPLLPSLPSLAPSVSLINPQPSFALAPVAPALAQAQLMQILQTLATAAFSAPSALPALSSALPTSSALPASSSALPALSAASPAPVASPSFSIQPSAHPGNTVPAPGVPTSLTLSVAPQGSFLSIPDFCAIYQIPQDDCARLERLGVVIGDPKIGEMSEERWRAEMFTEYTWGRVVLANKAYIRDVTGSSS